MHHFACLEALDSNTKHPNISRSICRQHHHHLPSVNPVHEHAGPVSYVADHAARLQQDLEKTHSILSPMHAAALSNMRSQHGRMLRAASCLTSDAVPPLTDPFTSAMRRLSSPILAMELGLGLATEGRLQAFEDDFCHGEGG